MELLQNYKSMAQYNQITINEIQNKNIELNQKFERYKFENSLQLLLLVEKYQNDINLLVNKHHQIIAEIIQTPFYQLICRTDDCLKKYKNFTVHRNGSARSAAFSQFG